jgi:diguanylate cyclase (GGDEF)-like protein
MDISALIDMIISISNNIFILLSIVFLYTLSNYELYKHKRIKQVVTGIVVGFLTLFLMTNPMVFEEGIVFDTRTILIPISGVFFGPITTIIASIIAIAYRVNLGGVGMMVGISTIVISAVIGILWRYIFRRHKFKNKYLEYYILGFTSNALVFLLMFFLPDSLNVIRQVFPIYLILFPVVTMLTGVVIKQQQFRIQASNLEKAQMLLLQSSIDASHNVEIYVVDSAYNYLTFNIFHKNQIKAYFNVEIDVGFNVLSLLKDDNRRTRIKTSIDGALKGEIIHDVIYTTLPGNKIIEERFTPLRRGHDILGVTVFIRDITEQRLHEDSIMRLSYYDGLTGLPNRRYFQEKLVEVHDNQYCPVSIITCDINGLKLFNDALGHKMGDLVLVKVAEILTRHLLPNGTVSRIGGDEFIFILPNTDYDTALKMMEKVDNEFDKHLFNGLKLSVSYGIATKLEGDHIDDVLKQSEEQMHKSKLFEKASHRSEFIKSILNTLREKNPREKDHSTRVATICTEIGKFLGMKKHDLNLLEAIASLHDIGKIAIDEAILNKPGKLTPKEWEAIKKHPEIGYRIISTAPEYAEIAEDILSHHEHFNGQGYPRGLSGEDIPIRARIVSIADAYDAMVSRRTYKEPMTHEQAILEIKRCSGTQFDPNLVNIFIDLIENGVLYL